MLSSKPSVSPFNNASNIKKTVIYFITLSRYKFNPATDTRMTIIQKIFLSVYLVLTFCCGSAQKSKNAGGYIVTAGNDTLGCKFNSYNSKKHPVSIQVNLNGNDTTFYPSQIRGFITPPGEEFVSRKIYLFKYNLSPQNAIAGEIPETDTIPAAFLKVLHAGRIYLYLYKDALKNDHYFIEKNNDLQELYSHLYLTTIGQTPSTLAPYLKEQSLTNNFQYYFGLKKMMQDCAALFADIDKTELKPGSLISLLKKYDRCSGSRDN